MVQEVLEVQEDTKVEMEEVLEVTVDIQVELEVPEVMEDIKVELEVKEEMEDIKVALEVKEVTEDIKVEPEVKEVTEDTKLHPEAHLLVDTQVADQAEDTQVEDQEVPLHLVSPHPVHLLTMVPHLVNPVVVNLLNLTATSNSLTVPQVSHMPHPHHPHPTTPQPNSLTMPHLNSVLQLKTTDHPPTLMALQPQVELSPCLAVEPEDQVREEALEQVDLCHHPTTVLPQLEELEDQPLSPPQLPLVKAMVLLLLEVSVTE